MWRQVAFERDLADGLNSVHLDGHPVALIKSPKGMSAFHGVCPHRGADLTHGGIVCGESIICPFHGLSIALGNHHNGTYSVPSLPLLHIDGLVFASSAPVSRTFEHDLGKLQASHHIVPGFQMTIRTNPEMVIENAFDEMHFRTVHGILNHPQFTIVKSRDQDVYQVEGIFRLPPSPWQKGGDGNAIDIPYSATAYSPFVVITTLGGDNPYAVITSCHAKPGGTEMYLSLAFPEDREFDREGARYLMTQVRAGVLQDVPIWELQAINVQQLMPDEHSVRGFHSFVASFDSGQ